MAASHTSCRKEPSAGQPAARAGSSSLAGNKLAGMPGAVLRSQTDSPIHWQPWTSATLELARSQNKLLFVVVALPQQPYYQQVLDSLASDAQILESINTQYIPVLVDGDASREIGILTADLCAEIKRPLHLPLLLWMTPEANPVAWMPVTPGRAASARELFGHSHMMVSRMWADDPDYVLNNSKLDNESRRGRIAQRRNADVASESPGTDAIAALRQLTSLYDPVSRSFDEAGGLFPSGALELLASSALMTGLPDAVRERSLETTRGLLEDLLNSAMFDPLDGGVFSSRRGATWAFPSFHRDCVSQARASVALVRAYQATGNTLALARARAVVDFSEKNHATADGLFALGMNGTPDPSEWLWTVEQVETALSPEDAALWMKATGMRGLGNLPSEADTTREYFRLNALMTARTPAELAAGTGSTEEEIIQRLDAARKALLKERTQRLSSKSRDDAAHAGATFRMVSAYAALFNATGEEAFRTKALATLQKAREAFSADPGLKIFTGDAPAPVAAGRAFHYALALQAILDVADIDNGEAWMLWADDLATTAAELFTAADFLKECPDEAKILDLPVTDLAMLFDDSTAGVISLAECRMAARGRPMVDSFTKLAIPLPVFASQRPILHTDLILATLARHHGVSVSEGSGLSPEMRDVLSRLPLRIIKRRTGEAGKIPAGSVKMTTETGEERIFGTPEALREALLPPATNS